MNSAPSSVPVSVPVPFNGALRVQIVPSASRGARPLWSLCALRVSQGFGKEATRAGTPGEATPPLR